MGISFNRALGIHEQALAFRSGRSAILADNLANADTPGYKAKDINFAQILDQHAPRRPQDTQVQATHSRHFTTAAANHRYDSLYRIPHQPSIDGNTVEEQVEHAEFMKNSLAFQASFQFLNSKFSGLTTAIKGE